MKWLQLAMRGMMVLFLAIVATGLTTCYSLWFGHHSTGPRMAAIDQVLKAKGSLVEVQKLVGPPSEVFLPGQTEGSRSLTKVQFWTPGPGQEVQRYAEEALPCYFALWLLVDSGSQKILDSRLFRLDQVPSS